jgi:hypothetical protein
MGVYDQIKSAFQDLIAPELHELRAEVRRVNEKIDNAQSVLVEKINYVDAMLNTKIDGLRVEMTSLRSEVISEIRRVDARVEGLDRRMDAFDRELHTAIDIRERLAALEARRQAES